MAALAGTAAAALARQGYCCSCAAPIQQLGRLLYFHYHSLLLYTSLKRPAQHKYSVERLAQPSRPGWSRPRDQASNACLSTSWVVCGACIPLNSLAAQNSVAWRQASTALCCVLWRWQEFANGVVCSLTKQVNQTCCSKTSTLLGDAVRRTPSALHWSASACGSPEHCAYSTLPCKCNAVLRSHVFHGSEAPLLQQVQPLVGPAAVLVLVPLLPAVDGLHHTTSSAA